jgi:DNA-binding MarR family transcriptional regulator
MQTTSHQVPTSTLLAALGRDATARVRRAIGPLGVGAQQFLVLSQLRVLGQASQAELADAAGIDRSNLATIAHDLCERGFVVRTRHERDRRRYVLRLSTSGEQLLRRSNDAIDAANDELFSPLDETQRTQLHALLRALADGVDLCPSDEDAS